MPDATQIADQIRTSPGLRGKLVYDAREVVNDAIPRKRFALTASKETQDLRDQVLAELAKEVHRDAEYWSAAHAEAVIEQFFADTLKNPQRSFTLVVLMSCIVFVGGLVSTGIGIYAALSAESVIPGAVLAGTGLIATIGAILCISSQGIDKAIAGHTQTRLIVAGFATELGHLRALNLSTTLDVAEANEKIRAALDQAVHLVQNNVDSR